MIEKNIIKFLHSKEDSLYKYCKKHHLNYKIMSEAILEYNIDGLKSSTKKNIITNTNNIEYNVSNTTEHCIKYIHYI